MPRALTTTLLAAASMLPVSRAAQKPAEPRPDKQIEIVAAEEGRDREMRRSATGESTGAPRDLPVTNGFRSIRGASTVVQNEPSLAVSPVDPRLFILATNDLRRNQNFTVRGDTPYLIVERDAGDYNRPPISLPVEYDNHA